MKDDTIQAISKALGLIIIYVVGIGIKAWLLSWCVSFFFFPWCYFRFGSGTLWCSLLTA